jgi:Zn-dependent protease with chaperone function
MTPQILPGLRSSDYEHPFDRKALNALEGTPGFEYLMKKFWEYGIETMLTVQCTGSNIQVTKNNFPRLHETFAHAVDTLDLPVKPRLYFELGADINSYATGVENPIVILSSESVDRMTDDELLFIMGHELGHIKSNHVLYQNMGEVIPILGSYIGQVTFGVGNVLSLGLTLALQNWKRMAQFTADRAGLLACQNYDAAVSAMIKIAGLPLKYYDKNITEDFIQQAKDFHELDYESLSKIAKVMATLTATNPWTVQRAAELNRFHSDGMMETIMTSIATGREITLDASALACPACGTELNADAPFCGGCGKKLIRE